jgi:predicted nucleic acid-binding protein
VKVAIDTSFFVYAQSVGFSPGDRVPGLPRDRRKVEIAMALLPRLARPGVVVTPAQVLGELFTVLVRKAGRPAAAARAAVLAWRGVSAVQPTTEAVLLDAFDLAAERGLQVWDAVVVAAAAEAGCAFLMVEDAAVRRLGAHRGVQMVDPFAEDLPPLLAARLG